MRGSNWIYLIILLVFIVMAVTQGVTHGAVEFYKRFCYLSIGFITGSMIKWKEDE